MNDAEIKKILDQMESEFSGDPEHDADVMYSWGERYRSDPEAEGLLAEIGRRLFDLIAREDRESLDMIYEDMITTADDDFTEACELIASGNQEEALNKLLVLTALIQSYKLPDSKVWMDFASYTDYLVFREYWAEEIGGREIVRHPLHPAEILYTCGKLLIEMNRPEEALDPLLMLIDLDPVCPQYLFELGEAYKRIGALDEAEETAREELLCASDRRTLSRAYRDLGYCFCESGRYEDAVILYVLSQRCQPTRQAEAELIWIRRRAGIASETISDETIASRCAELDIPIGISETVRRAVIQANTPPSPPEEDTEIE